MFDLRILAVGVAIAATAVLINAAIVVHSDGSLPDPNMTPGVVRTTDQNIVCNQHTSDVRNVTDAMKRQVRARYGISSPTDKWCSGPHGCEIDHLIPLTLGGANDIANLWPQPYDGEAWTASDKDRLEVHLHKLVCDSKLDLGTAQTAIRTNWIEAYKLYLNPTPIRKPAKIKKAGD